MSFNLNKNDGSQPNDPASKSQFNLSKNDAPGASQPARKNQSWILILLALIVLGGAFWYFKSQTPNVNETLSDSTSSSANKEVAALAPVQSSAAVTPDSIVGKMPVSTDTHLPAIAASFDKGSVSFAKILPSIVSDIVKQSNSNSTISVNGYASSEGDLTVNQKISQMRADSYKKYLISKGVSENKITAIGKGIDNPIASNDTEEGRRKNRRVEVIIQ